MSTAQIIRHGGVRSVFAKLFAIMLAMSLCLLIAVSVFFMAVITPSFNGSLAHFETELARTFAAISPDLAAATAFKKDTGVDVAYRGPKGEWHTTRRAFDFAQAATQREYFLAVRNVTVVP